MKIRILVSIYHSQAIPLEQFQGLIYMPTACELEARGELSKIDGGLDAGEQEERLIYAMGRATSWMDEKLLQLDSDGFYDGSPSPSQQADALFYEFISGADLETDWPPHTMRPSHHGIWELRTADLRFFGWFWRNGIFILSAVDQAKRCKEKGLYSGYRNQAVADMNRLELCEPKFITGELEDVL